MKIPPFPPIHSPSVNFSELGKRWALIIGDDVFHKKTKDTVYIVIAGGKITWR